MVARIFRTAQLFECPLCHVNMNCRVDANDFDDDNRKARRRVCPDCGPFSTVEVPVLLDGKPVPITQFATNKRQQVRDAQRIRKGYRAIGARYRSGTLSVTVRYRPPTIAPFKTCWQGHDFTPANTYVAPNGRRSCLTCKRAHAREYRLANIDKCRAQGRLNAASQRLRRKQLAAAAVAPLEG